MTNAYIYPIWAAVDKIIPNPYLDKLIDALSSDIRFVNKDRPSSRGILDIIGYYRDIDYILLNWIEDLPDKKGGSLQVLFFIFLVKLARLQKKKIVWTMHNKRSHYSSHRHLKRFLFRFLLRNSDYILTHSREGLVYAGEFGISGVEAKMSYFPHPLENKMKTVSSDKQERILIWGSIIPYKGIHKFLEHLHASGCGHKFPIRIIGKVKPDEYEKEISQYCNDKIILENRYIREEELQELVSSSSAVIFTYFGSSVLSSGVLMDSLSYGAKVLGPRVGAFQDMEEEGLVLSYDSYDGLIALMEDLNRGDEAVRKKGLEEFIEQNNWKAFAARFSNWILNKE